MAHITLYHVADLIGMKVFRKKSRYMKYIWLFIIYFIPLCLILLTFVTSIEFWIRGMQNVFVHACVLPSVNANV